MSATDGLTLARTSPAYAAHVAADAVFQSKNGWQRVSYFQENAAKGDHDRRPEGAAASNWSPAVEAEHRAVRERAGLFDLTSFGKVEVSGPGAGAMLEQLCSNVVERGPGRLTYTQMLNEDGGVIADVTIAQQEADRFLVVTGTSALPHDLVHLTRCAQERTDVEVRDVTSALACFGVWGPQARNVLAPLVDVALGTDEFPYMTTQAARIGGAPVRLSRVTFVGELGWEIYIASEYGRALWDTLSAAVAAVGGARCGYGAIDSLRSEKGYLYLGADLLADRTPVESGLRAFVRTKKEFLGRDAVLRGMDPTSILRAFVLEEDWYALSGGETIEVPGGATSTVTSAGLGYTVGSAVGFAYLPAEIGEGTELRVLVEGRALPARVVSQPLYDSAGSRIRS